ncbi:MAG: tRNA adenosine(34) deaminase TadA [Clostridia bacterium]|nr:tRNA adenosine(34) deaminase TadA [Clostridia bacterium]
MENDIKFMREALALAKKAAELGEVPVGAVVVNSEGIVIADAYNLRENKKSVIAHAEIIAIEQACRKLGDWRLSGCTLYVTLEPCPMCAGAIVNSRISRVVFGAYDMQAGCCGSVINFNAYPFNHAFEIEGGVLEEECSAILADFFKNKRKN